MAGLAVDDALDGLVIEIPTGSMTMAIEADGTVKTVPAEETTAAETQQSTEEQKPVPTLAELEQARRERDDFARRTRELETESQTRAQALADAQAAHEAERGKRTQAEQLAHQRTLDSAALAYHRVNAELQGVTTNISSLKNYVAQAEANLQSAHEANDPTRIARATAEISRATADLSAMEQAEGQWRAELDRAKRGYDQVAAQTPRTEEQPVKKETKTEAQTQTQQVDPDAWITNARKAAGDKVGDWLAKNRQFVADAKMNRKLTRFADEYMDDHGQSALRSDEFIAALNAKFFPEEKPVTTETPKKEEKPAAKTAHAAPVSRGNDHFSSGNLNASKIKLPADVVAFCKATGLDPTSYALSVVEEIKRGDKPKEWLDPGYNRGI